MKYIDKVYGETKITEPVILELIKSPSFQRLKYIDQGGYKPLCVKPKIHVPKYAHSRFAHSIGVYILLKKYNAPIEEQIAGLLHDVSHSAFSHCIDYILEGGSEKEHNHQDKIHNTFVNNSEIPSILNKHGHNLDYILDDKNFPLKERNLPDLCADRIDYSLRTALIFGEEKKTVITKILHNLVVEQTQWIFKDFETAKKYAQLFLMLNKVHYSGLQSGIMFNAVGNCIKHALKMKYISIKDLYTTDNKVIAKVKKYINEDKPLNILWKRMNNKIKAKNNTSDYDADVYCKSRVVDPLLFQKNRIKRLSEVDKSWIKILREQSKPKHYFIKYET